MAAHKYTPEERIVNFWSKVDKSGGKDSCWLWMAGCSSNGYGTFFVDGKSRTAHRAAWIFTYGEIPSGLYVCHSCDTPTCCNPSHLWLGTALDNTHDMIRKGRSATGERNGNYTHPENRRFGDRNGQHTHPEKTVRGDRHWTRLFPERVKGVFGDNNGSRRHPEKMPRGEKHKNSKLTDDQVRAIKMEYVPRIITLDNLADKYHVSKSTISVIVRGLRKTTNE